MLKDQTLLAIFVIFVKITTRNSIKIRFISGLIFVRNVFSRIAICIFTTTVKMNLMKTERKLHYENVCLFDPL